jgi:hypothetical protein
MPNFQNNPPIPKTGGSKKGEKLPAKPTDNSGVPLIIERRCKVCTSPHRHVVDQMLVGAYSYSEIARHFEFVGIDRRSISGHHKKHMSYQDAAIRAVIQRNAEMAQQNHEEGVERLVTKQTYLEIAIQKAYDQLVNNMVEIPAGDAVKLIEALQRLETQYQDAAVDELRVQFNAFMLAVKQVVPPDMWEEIRTLTHQNAGRGSSFVPASAPQITDAQVVEDEHDPLGG